MKIRSAVLSGLSAVPVEVEARRTTGVDGLTIAGWPDAGAREMRVRVRSALAQCGIELPYGVTISVTPELKSSDGALDLAAALAVSSLVQDKQYLPPNTLVFGELSLSGRILPIRGLTSRLRLAELALVPSENGPEASLAVEDVIGAISDALTKAVGSREKATARAVERAEKAAAVARLVRR